MRKCGLHTYIHTYTHTYIHTYIHTYTGTFTYIHIYVRKTCFTEWELEWGQASQQNQGLLDGSLRVWCWGKPTPQHPRRLGCIRTAKWRLAQPSTFPGVCLLQVTSRLEHQPGLETETGRTEYVGAILCVNKVARYLLACNYCFTLCVYPLYIYTHSNFAQMHIYTVWI